MHLDVRKIAALDIIGFTFGLSLAWYLDWQTKDLIWSLWLTSLFVGYLTILATIGTGLYFAYHILRHCDFEKKDTKIFLVFVPTVTIFLLGFFSLHFCGFHAGHATFLEALFPLRGVKTNLFSSAFTNPPKLLYLAYTEVFPLYGMFLVSAVISERKNIFGPFLKVRATIKGDPASPSLNKPKNQALASDPIGETFTAPYKNVIRIHCLILFFGFVHFFISLDSFLIFVAAYSIFFFPKFEHPNPKNQLS